MADYKINHMTGRLYKFFTGSPSSYYDYLINRIQDVHEDSAFNDQKNIFYARVVSDTSNIAPQPPTEESKGNTSFLNNILPFGGEKPSQYYNYAIKFRFAGEDESRNQIPDPDQATDATTKATLISLHSYAIVDRDAGILLGEPLTQNALITIREEDGVYYVTGKLNGDYTSLLGNIQEGVKESFSKRRPSPLSEFVNPACLGRNTVEKGSCYNSDQTKIQTGDKTTNTKFLLDWDDYIILGYAFKYIREYIAQHESGRDGYEANNLGEVGKSVNTEMAFGKKLVDMTLKELRANMNDSGGILFATGKYQIIPRTLRDAMASLNIPVGTKYDQETQDALCVYLAITKRPNLGKYLMIANDDIIKAGNDLSLEWAFAPLLGPYRHQGRVYLAGQSIYDGDSAGNKTNPDYTKTLAKALKRQRDFNASLYASSTNFKKIIDKYGK